MIKVQAPELYRDSGAFEARKRQSLRARYVYGLIFFATNLLAWFIRDYGAKLLGGLHRTFALCISFQTFCICHERWMKHSEFALLCTALLSAVIFRYPGLWSRGLEMLPFWRGAPG